MEAGVIVNIILVVVTLAGLIGVGIVGYGKLMSKLAEIVTTLQSLSPEVQSLRTAKGDHDVRLAVVERALRITR